MTARLTAASSAAREVRATRLPTCTGCKRLPKWHTHMVYIADPRPKRRPPGFRCDRDGLSHSVDPQTTTYNVTLPLRSTLVARQCTLSFHARRLRLRTRQSAESWSEAELKPSLRNNPWEPPYQGLRGGSMDDGRAQEPPAKSRLTCYACNAVECGRVAGGLPCRSSATVDRR